ncbi:hypothetical protein [Emticicia fontis]
MKVSNSNKIKSKIIKKWFYDIDSSEIREEMFSIDPTLNNNFKEEDSSTILNEFFDSTILDYQTSLHPNAEEDKMCFSKANFYAFFDKNKENEKSIIIKAWPINRKLLTDRLELITVNTKPEVYIDSIFDAIKDKFDEAQLAKVSVYLRNKGKRFACDFVDWLKIEQNRREVLSLGQEIKRFANIFFAQLRNILKRLLLKATRKPKFRPQVVGFSFKNIITETLFYCFNSEEDNKLYLRNFQVPYYS